MKRSTKTGAAEEPNERSGIAALFQTNQTAKENLLYGVFYAAITVIAAMICYGLGIPNPNYILVLLLFVATVRRGYIAGIFTGLSLILFAMFFFSENHNFLSFSDLNRSKVFVIAWGTLLHMLVCCGLYVQSQKRIALIKKYHTEKNSISQLALQAFSESYLNVFIINTREDSAVIVKQNGFMPEGLSFAKETTLRFEKSFETYIKTRVASEDQARVRQMMKPEAIERNLADRQEYSYFYHVMENGERHNFEAKLIKTAQENLYVIGFANADEMMSEERQRQKMYANMERLQERTKLLQSMVMSIARIVDAKDIYTAKHSSRVTKYSLHIGEKLGLTPETMANLERSAMLHDIGKVAIPDGVLTKKGKLSKEEFHLMKSHPVFGYEILKDFDPNTQISEGARYHHERYDGTGYPDGLKGEEIPLFGRIIAIADAYDAMSSNRIYRPKCDDAYIMNELRKGRGTQFDPQLCDIFLSLLEDGTVAAENEEDNTLTLEKAYERFGGRYFVVHQRLKKDERILEYLGDFLEDGEFDKLKKALAEGDDRAAFRAVHTLKGISMNLDFVNLEKICIALTENLRDMPINAQTPGLFEQLEKEYTEICGIIRQLLPAK